MNASVYRHEVLSRRRSVAIWSLAVAAILLIYLSLFSAFADQAALLNEMMARFPPQMRAAFGLDRVDLSTVLGYFSFVFLFVQLCLAIQAGNYGFGLVSIEESELTADFLLSKPVSRAQVLTSKLLAALTGLLVTLAVVWVSSYVSLSLFRGSRSYDGNVLRLILLGTFLFQLFFLSVGLVVSLLVKRVRSVTPYSLGLAFGSYILVAFSGMLGDVKLELITPFRHFDPARIVQQGGYDTPLVLLNVTVTLLALAISYWLYIRRDIPAVS